MECRIVTSFPDPGKAAWSGVLEWVDETTTDREGRNPRILKVQCAMRNGKNGFFLSMPSRQSAAGQYYDLVNIGSWFMDSGVAAVQKHLAVEERTQALRAAGAPSSALPGYHTTTSPPGEYEHVEQASAAPGEYEATEAEFLAGYEEKK